MKLTIDTGSYNEKRYGKPWIARIDFSTNTNGEYLWGSWVGQIGCEGMLILEVEPGDIIARGQRDTRNIKYSAPSFYKVNEDGSLESVSKKEAYLAFIKKAG